MEQHEIKLNEIGFLEVGEIIIDTLLFKSLNLTIVPNINHYRNNLSNLIE